MNSKSARTIRIAAALIDDGASRLLLVRKAGTEWFMQAGGKTEVGETPVSALRRELDEQIGLVLPAILVTGRGDMPMAVAALKQRAFDFLTKPFAADHLVAAVRRGLERRALVLENRRLRAAAMESEAENPLIGFRRRLRGCAGRSIGWRRPTSTC